MDASVCLKAIDISKSIDNKKILDNFSISLFQGDFHSVLGAKGAGKSTLLKILSGALAADSGYIEINGKLMHKYSPALARQEKLMALFEDQFLMQDMTVAENIFMSGYMPNAVAFLSHKKIRQQAAEILDYLNISIDPDELPLNLSDFEKQQIQLARVYAGKTKIVISDSIVSGLNASEKQFIFEVFQKMLKDGISVMYFTHQIEDAIRISNKITVLRNGKRVSYYEDRDFDVPLLIQEMIECDTNTAKCFELTKDADDDFAYYRLSKAAESNGNLLGYLDEATDYIVNNLQADLSPGLIAEKVHVSPGYLMKLFKQYMGVSIMDYTNNMRMEKGKELLKKSNMKISQIAQMVGISNSQYFAVLFKKYTGMTPKEYRKTSMQNR